MPGICVHITQLHCKALGHTSGAAYCDGHRAIIPMGRQEQPGNDKGQWIKVLIQAVGLWQHL